MRIKTERQLKAWLDRRGGVSGWQPTEGKGGKPSSDWQPGYPPTGQIAYVKAGNGQVASVCLDSATSPLGDAGLDLSNALASQQGLINSLIGSQNQLLAHLQAQAVTLATLSNTVSATMERLSAAQAVSLPGEIAKGIATGITELGRLIGPMLVKERVDNGQRKEG